MADGKMIIGTPHRSEVIDAIRVEEALAKLLKDEASQGYKTTLGEIENVKAALAVTDMRLAGLYRLYSQIE